MADISQTIKAKSDQLNAGDLIGGPVTVQVLKVDVRGGDQPVSIHISGNYQPYKPCLSMRRVLAKLWGNESDGWINRWMTIYNEPTVVWAGKEEGGIRISHMEGITEAQSIPLRANKRQVIKWIVEPLVMQQQTEVTRDPKAPTVESIKELMNTCDDLERMKAYGELIAEHKASFTQDEISHLKQHYVDCCESIKQDSQQ